MTQQTSFKASYGIDASGQKVINVANADKTILTDGVNVGTLIQENTVQNYDPTRGYEKDFLVKQNDRLWIAQDNIKSPSGQFDENLWRSARVDPKWKPINSSKYLLKVGDFISIDTEIGTPVELTLPSDAQEGDNIVIRDIGGFPGFVDVVIKAGVQSIFDKNQRLAETRMTIPYSEWTFVYVNKLWNLYNGSEADLGKIISPGTYQVQAGQILARDYTKNEPIILNFPKNAVHGDVIQLIGLSTQLSPYYEITLNSYDKNSSIISQGQNTITLYKNLSGAFVYNSNISTWVFFDTNKLSKFVQTSQDTILFPNQHVSVVGNNNSTASTIKLTLPTKVEDGSIITIALNQVRLNQNVDIVPSANDSIITDKNLSQFPKRSSYPASGNWNSTKKLSFNGTSDYLPVITFSYSSSLSGWYVVSNIPALERVDPTSDSTRSRLGLISLATQAVANLDKENITSQAREVAITPETLANRTSLENRRGISRLATQDEVNMLSDSNYLDDVIVTPKKLDQKQSTETMRGLAEIATQDEANGSSDDSRIITAKKLDARRANPTMAGVARVVMFGATAPTGTNATRDSAGTNIYDYTDYSNIVTPKTLREFISTQNTLGTVYLASSAEVIAATELESNKPLVVTPATLHTKTATESRIGFTEIATQDETNTGLDDFRFITPKKLNSRISSETLTGISRYSTQSEFNSGLSNLIAEPYKIKTFFSDSNRTSVTSSSGLTQSGNLWTTTNFDIKQPSVTQRGTTSLATQSEVNSGIDNIKIVTPYTLANKKSTETSEGIIRLSTSNETISGSLTNVAVSPKNLINAIQVEKTWEAQVNTRGTVKISENGLTFVGNNVSGSTQNLDLYEKTGYAISPYELNKTLSNFLPLKAKASDSDLLDGLDSLQFVRQDVDQTVNGIITFSKASYGPSFVSSGSMVSTSGDFRTDNNHYLYLGKSGSDLVTLGSFNGLFNVLNTNTNVIEFSLNSGTLSLTGNINAINASINGSANISGSLVVGSQLAITGSSTQVSLGNLDNQTVLKTKDSNSLITTDASGSYVILSKKNYIQELKTDFVRKIGDDISGRLNVRSPIVAQVQESTLNTATALNSTNFGSWTINISSQSIYNQLPGYVVPVYDTNKDTGETLPWVGSYTEIKGPGTMSQFGSSEANGIGTYRIWAPRPASKVDNQNANTFYMNHWDPIRNAWSGWGRVFTNNAPPTASDIGAMSNNGSVFDSLKVRDWIQIGNLKIYADPTTKSVKFDWID